MKKETDKAIVVLAKQKVRLIKMIQKRNCILVYSDMNTWIDFCILVSDKDFNKAMEVTAKAYDDWWELPDAEFLPIAEYIGNCLEDNGIEFDMYYSNEEEE